jgi:hypothetical protein
MLRGFNVSGLLEKNCLKHHLDVYNRSWSGWFSRPVLLRWGLWPYLGGYACLLHGDQAFLRGRRVAVFFVILPPKSNMSVAVVLAALLVIRIAAGIEPTWAFRTEKWLRNA